MDEMHKSDLFKQHTVLSEKRFEVEIKLEEARMNAGDKETTPMMTILSKRLKQIDDQIIKLDHLSKKLQLRHLIYKMIKKVKNSRKKGVKKQLEF